MSNEQLAVGNARPMKDSGVEWIGEIPEEWTVSKVGFFYDVVLGKMLQAEKKDDSDTYEYYLCAQNVGGNRLKLDTLKQMWFSEEEIHSLEVRKGDLLVVEGGDIASCDIVTADLQRVFFQNALHRVRPIGKDDIRFLKYYLWMAKAIGYIDLICNKATIAHFSKEKFLALPYLLPTLAEQTRIADFLDRKCAEIDRVVAETEKTIEEYKALRQSVITEAVTKGVRGDRPMKDSGVEWIGEISEEWDATRFKYVATVKANLVEPTEYLNYTQVSPENIEKDTGRLLPCKTVEEVGVISGNHLFFAGQIIYSKIRPKLNKAIIAPFDGLCSADMYPIETMQNKQFFLYELLSNVVLQQVALITEDRVKMPKINQDELGNVWFSIPPLDEQQEIANYLDTRCAEIDRLIAAKQQLLTELESYKKSVIYEYVTGKKEVPAE